jgi:hypothetical protein
MMTGASGPDPRDAWRPGQRDAGGTNGQDAGPRAVRATQARTGSVGGDGLRTWHAS